MRNERSATFWTIAGYLLIGLGVTGAVRMLIHSLSIPQFSRHLRDHPNYYMVPIGISILMIQGGRWCLKRASPDPWNEHSLNDALDSNVRKPMPADPKTLRPEDDIKLDLGP